MSKSNKFPKVFCPVPFSSLILSPNGLVGSCRELGIGHVLGSIDENTIDEIWNGEKFRSWRREFLTGNIITCKKHIKSNSCHKLHVNLDLLPYVDPSEYVTTPILRLSPDINGFCNLKCPFCNIWDMPNGKYDKVENFWQHLGTHILPNLIQIDPLAGEPFLQDDLYKIIDMSAESNPDLSWKFTSNAQWKLTPKIKSYLLRIKIRLISISLDSVNPSTYSIIRHPGKLERSLETIRDLQSFQNEKDFNLEVNFSIQRKNVYEIIDIIRFCQEADLYPFIQYVDTPKNLSPSTLSEYERKKILSFYLSNMQSQDFLIAHRVLRSLIMTFSQDQQSKYLKFINHLTNGKFIQLLDLLNNHVSS